MASEALFINNRITLAGWELTEQFVLAGGPGGSRRAMPFSSIFKNSHWFQR